jgi:Na+-driven multidrug efflux pump
MAISYSYAAMLRSTGEVRTPMVVNILALAINLAVCRREEPLCT